MSRYSTMGRAQITYNPPYAKRVNLCPKLNDFMSDNYSESKQDLFTAFIQKNINLLNSNGLCSMITQSSFLFKSQFKSMRKYLLSNAQFVNLVSLGAGAFEEIQLSNKDFYFKPHISWTRVSSHLNMRFYEGNCMFDNTSPAIFTNLNYNIAYYNSIVCEY